MYQVTGPIDSISLGGRDFQTSGEGTGTLRGGLFSNEHKPNGNPRTGRVTKTPVPWKFEGQEIALNMTESDFEYVTSLHNGPDPFDVVIRFGHGRGTYNASGNFEGEPPGFEAMTGGATIDLAGFGELKKQG